MTAAALGTVLTIDTFDGPQEVDVRAGTQPAETVTLRGLGVGVLSSGGRRGDLHVHIQVKVPTGLDDSEQDLLRSLAQKRGEEHPQARLAPAGSGVFSRLRDRFAGR